MKIESMISKWKKGMNRLSGNLTTNERMPENLKKILLEEDYSLSKEISFKEMVFPKLGSPLGKIKGLDILSGLQKIAKKDHLTLFRAIRFPTFKRIHKVLFNQGASLGNFEQERILEIYGRKDYALKRGKIKDDKLFSTQPQERVVKGIPFFTSVNDALQIHRAYRNDTDRVMIIVFHIPFNLIKNKKIKLFANTAIDLDYANCERDFEIKDFVSKEGVYFIDYRAIRTRGIYLHEMYLQKLPWNLKGCQKAGIKQDFFLLEIYRIKNKTKLKKLAEKPKLLKKYQYLLHGFFGDQSVFCRWPSEFLPFKCYRIGKNEHS